MRFSSPTLALAALLPLLANAQHADETICESTFGSSYTDACCSTIISRGPNSPCTDIEYVSNLTECSTRHYPTGWAVCVLKPELSLGIGWAHAPSGLFSANMTEVEMDYAWSMFTYIGPENDHNLGRHV